MHGDHDYDPNCPDCVPCFMNAETGEVMPRDDARQLGALAVWWAAPFEQRRAFMRATSNPFPDAADVLLCAPLTRQMVVAMSRPAPKGGSA